MISIQEVLSKTVDPKAPLQSQEFYELRLFEIPMQPGTRFCFGQTHAQWSDMDRQVMFEGEDLDCFWTADEAMKRYTERRLALGEMGFIYSDMDPVT